MKIIDFMETIEPLSLENISISWNIYHSFENQTDETKIEGNFNIEVFPADSKECEENASAINELKNPFPDLKFVNQDQNYSVIIPSHRLLTVSLEEEKIVFTFMPHGIKPIEGFPTEKHISWGRCSINGDSDQKSKILKILIQILFVHQKTPRSRCESCKGMKMLIGDNDSELETELFDHQLICYDCLQGSISFFKELSIQIEEFEKENNLNQSRETLFQLIDGGIELADRLNNEKLHSEFLYFQALLFSKDEDPKVIQESLDLLERIIMFSSSWNYVNLREKSEKLKSTILENIPEIQSVKEEIIIENQKAIKGVNNPIQIGINYLQKAKAFEKQGKYQEAIYCIKRASRPLVDNGVWTDEDFQKGQQEIVRLTSYIKKVELELDEEEVTVPVEEVVSEPVEKVVAEPVEEVVAEPVEEVVAEPVEEVVSEPVEESVAEPVEEVVSEPVEEVVAEPVEEVVSEPVEEVVAEPVEELVAEPVEESVAEPVEELVAEPVEEVVAVPVEELVAEPVEELVAEPVEESVAEPVEEVVAEPVEELVTEPVEESVAEPVEESVAEPVEESVAESIQVPLKPVEKISPKPVEESVAESIQAPLKPVKAVSPEPVGEDPIIGSIEEIMKKIKKSNILNLTLKPDKTPKPIIKDDDSIQDVENFESEEKPIIFPVETAEGKLEEEIKNIIEQQSSKDKNILFEPPILSEESSVSINDQNSAEFIKPKELSEEKIEKTPKKLNRGYNLFGVPNKVSNNKTPSIKTQDSEKQPSLKDTPIVQKSSISKRRIRRRTFAKRTNSKIEICPMCAKLKCVCGYMDKVKK